MRPLLISDTNVIIDLEEGGVLELLFQLPHEFAVPDILYDEELHEQHSHLIGLGLQTLELSSDSMGYAMGLMENYGGPSANDCFALALAKQEDCPLVTGDKRLRKAADQEQVSKLGTIWLLEQLLEHNLVSIEEIDESVKKMKLAGSRLPWGLLAEKLDKYRI
ncbi:PIN domain-containing protein [Neptuniibacter sp. QD34_54]|uniref:PIN domain-containing protein n=1 Tax=Neptuniibacter sp. QD34_54 TaxID=3398208 RepID=UPI0039F4B909